MSWFFIRHIFSAALLVVLLTTCRHQEYIPHQGPDPLPPCLLPERIRVALVLGSGGVRGIAHVGVLEELEAAGINIDLIIGCSAGSIVGALYADCPQACRIKQIIETMRSDSLFDINIWQSRFGLSQGRALQRALRKNLRARTFEDLQIPLIVVATDLYSGELVPIGSGDIIKSVQASCSVPLLFTPCEMHGRVLVDGGVVNPVPVCLARDLGVDVVIAVDLCELLPRTFPSHLFGIATRSAEIAFIWQTDVCSRYADIVIQPKMCGIGMFNDKMKNEIYAAGREACREQIPRLKEILSRFPESENDSNYPNYPHIVHLKCYHPKLKDETLSPFWEDRSDENQILAEEPLEYYPYPLTVEEIF